MFGCYGGVTELLAHMRKAYVPGIYAITNETESYTFILFADGSWSHGIFYCTEDRVVGNDPLYRWNIS